MTGTLYLCATPIGNLEDMTFRVIRTLKEVDLIAAEDTRNSIKLLNHFEIQTPMTSYHEYNKYEKGRKLVEKLLEGQNIALITDAGTPGISDPGEDIFFPSINRCTSGSIINSIASPILPPGTTNVLMWEMNEPCNIASSQGKSIPSRLRKWITTKLSSSDGIPFAANGFEVSTVGTRWKLRWVRENCGVM